MNYQYFKRYIRKNPRKALSGYFIWYRKSDAENSKYEFFHPKLVMNPSRIWKNSKEIRMGRGTEKLTPITLEELTLEML